MATRSRLRWRAGYAAQSDDSQITGLLQADWSTATGTTENALEDGGLLNAISPEFGSNGEVVVNPGLGFPAAMANVLKVVAVNGNRSAWLELQKSGLGEIAVGETRTFRWYESNHHQTAAEGATDSSHHGDQDGLPSGAGSSQNWNLTDGTNYVGEWEPSFLISNGADRFYLMNTVTPTRLSKAVAYRFEFQMTRIDTTTFRVKAWVFDASTGVQLYGPSDWKSSANSGETMNSDRAYTFNNLAGTAGFNIGLNGSGTSSYPLHHSYKGGLAIATSLSGGGPAEDATIGVYGSVVGEPS